MVDKEYNSMMDLSWTLLYPGKQHPYNQVIYWFITRFQWYRHWAILLPFQLSTNRRVYRCTACGRITTKPILY